MTHNEYVYSEPIACKLAKQYLKPNDHILLHINHDLSDIIAFHNLVASYFYYPLFIAIPYNITEFAEDSTLPCKNFYKVYRKDGDYFIFRDNLLIAKTGADLHTQIDDMITLAVRDVYHQIDTHKIVMIEDGGYHYSLFRELEIEYPKLKAALLGCVEQTRNGLRAYHAGIAQSPIDYPVFTVARSKIKMNVESLYIALSAVNLTTEFLELLNDSIDGNHVAVTGYGAIGRYISKLLELRACNPYVLENDNTIRHSALKNGIQLRSLTDPKDFSSNLVIIGSTGNASFRAEMLDAFLKSTSDTLTLVSISSKQAEFQEFFRSLQQYEHVAEPIWAKSRYLGTQYTITVDNTQKTVRVFADGYPINFFCTWRKSLPPHVIDMIYAEIIYLVHIVIASDPAVSPSLYMLGSSHALFSDIENEIFKEWADAIDQKGYSNYLHLIGDHPCEEYLRHCQ